MTDKLAISLASVLVLLIGIDALVADMSATAFILRKLIGLITYLAFWR